jgi:predicted metal-dependent hydrolase
LIGINTLFQLPAVPEEVLLVTIAHELCHYAHGFGSPLPRKYSSPHAHQVVERELGQRRLGACLARCEAWIEQHWFAFYEQQRASGWSDLGDPHAVVRPGKRL